MASGSGTGKNGKVTAKDRARAKRIGTARYNKAKTASAKRLARIELERNSF